MKTNKLEMSLDEIIRADSLQKKRSESQKEANGSTKSSVKGTRSKDALRIRKGTGGIQKRPTIRYYDTKKYMGPTRLLVTNLDYGVTDADLEELFNENGLMEKGSVHYDSLGNSMGTAELIFRHRGDALRIIKMFHGVRLDGRRLKIHLVKITPDFKNGLFKSGSRRSSSFNNPSLRSDSSFGPRHSNRDGGQDDEGTWDFYEGDNFWQPY
ncbi:THO complex subunit 4 [Drosophila eugracilis]|uniref:THO complex subunit 4 n=1 Tax=Drosophila eugracilis TaxID=29029 RepID=UPI001BDA1469|nr:THO complex subunit 4 [Drosophila eugracilis]